MCVDIAFYESWKSVGGSAPQITDVRLSGWSWAGLPLSMMSSITLSLASGFHCWAGKTGSARGFQFSTWPHWVWNNSGVSGIHGNHGILPSHQYCLLDFFYLFFFPRMIAMWSRIGRHWHQFVAMDRLFFLNCLSTHWCEARCPSKTGLFSCPDGYWSSIFYIVFWIFLFTCKLWTTQSLWE